MNDRKSIEESAESGLHSLLIQTAQVGIGFGTMLALTGGKPSAAAIALTSAGGVAFVAAAEERRLTKEHKQLVEKHRLELEKNDSID